MYFRQYEAIFRRQRLEGVLRDDSRESRSRNYEQSTAGGHLCHSPMLWGFSSSMRTPAQLLPKTQNRISRRSPKRSPSHLASGLAEAFRSNQTAPFAQMIGTLFSNSNGQQRAGILNHLLSSVEPGAASGILGNFLGTGSQVTPEQAQQVSPEAVHQLAAQAEQNDPSIIEKASGFYAQHPTLVKALGAGSLALIMSHMSRRL